VLTWKYDQVHTHKITTAVENFSRPPLDNFKVNRRRSGFRQIRDPRVDRNSRVERRLRRRLHRRLRRRRRVGRRLRRWRQRLRLRLWLNSARRRSNNRLRRISRTGRGRVARITQRRARRRRRNVTSRTAAQSHAAERRAQPARRTAAGVHTVVTGGVIRRVVGRAPSIASAIAIILRAITIVRAVKATRVTVNRTDASLGRGSSTVHRRGWPRGRDVGRAGLWRTCSGNAHFRNGRRCWNGSLRDFRISVGRLGDEARAIKVGTLAEGSEERSGIAVARDIAHSPNSRRGIPPIMSGGGKS
jgi:hypothetical protein